MSAPLHRPGAAPPALPGPTGATARLGEALAATGRVRVAAVDILRCWDACVPELRGDISRHQLLVAALEDLAGAGVIALPRGSWDHSFRPPLPCFVVVPGSRRAGRDQAWRTFPWRAELGWAASLATLSPRQFADLVTINDWLSAGGASAAVVPQRFRAAEVLGNEKAFDELSTSALWGQGRLSFELLRAERRAPPIVVRRVGPGTEMLVVENADPFWLCSQILAAGGGPIGRVVWGAGKAFLSTAPALAEELERPSRLWYWGDADPQGVRIPSIVAGLLRTLGLAPLEPHGPLWGAYACCVVHEPGQHRWDAVPTGWLGPASGALMDAVTANGRVAQEAVGLGQIEEALAPRVPGC